MGIYIYQSPINSQHFPPALSLCAWLSVCLCGLSLGRSVSMSMSMSRLSPGLSVWIEEEEEARKMAVNLFTILGLKEVNDLCQYGMNQSFPFNLSAQ